MMSGRNAYFQLLIKVDGTYLKLFGAEPGGISLVYDDISNYLLDKKIYEYDKVVLGRAIANLKNVAEVKLTSAIISHQDEHVRVEIDRNKLYAKCRFYPSSNGENLLTKDDIIASMVQAGVKFGVDETLIIQFLRERKYCTDYILAKARMPIQGRSASIEYHFNTDLTMKPKTNEDGSVDFHTLDLISLCNKGDLLATLTPVDNGKPGIDVCGNLIRPNKVNNQVLRHGNNITLSEDGLHLYSNVDGHVSLTDGRVFVSNTYEIAADVDSSTGDIDYEGNVIVKGNIITGFFVKAKGNIEVYGVVEGAYIEAGGHIILRRGMQGMNKGILKAEGNIVTKFIENAEAIAGGYFNSDSIMHSRISAKGDVVVAGRRGLVTGGEIRSGTLISLKTAGSYMGTNTLLEVGIDPMILDEFRELEKTMSSLMAEKERISQVVASAHKKLQSGSSMSFGQLESLKQLTKTSIYLNTQLTEATVRYDILKIDVESNASGMILVKDVVYPGTKIIISNAVYFVRDAVHHTKFVRDRADIKLIPL